MNFTKRENFLHFWVPMILAILVYCSGDVLLKIGNIEIESSLPGVLKSGFWFAFITNLPIVLAFTFALLSKLIMGFILSKFPLGVSEGIFLALTSIITFIFGIIFFDENMTVLDGVAICFIALGIFMVYFDMQNSKSTKEDL